MLVITRVQNSIIILCLILLNFICKCKIWCYFIHVPGWYDVCHTFWMIHICHTFWYNNRPYHQIQRKKISAWWRAYSFHPSPYEVGWGMKRVRVVTRSEQSGITWIWSKREEWRVEAGKIRELEWEGKKVETGRVCKTHHGKLGTTLALVRRGEKSRRPPSHSTQLYLHSENNRRY